MMNVKEVKVFGKEVSVHIMGEYAFETYIEDGMCQEEELERLVNQIYVDKVEGHNEFVDDEDDEISVEDVWVTFTASVYDSDTDEYHTLVFDEKGNFKYEI